MTDWAQTGRMSVRVTLAEGMITLGDVHLQPRVAWRDGPETPLEMLNREEEFFPLTLPQGDCIFVAKSQVAVVAFTSPAAEPDPDRESAAQHIPLEVMLVGGGEYRGIANSELPPTRGRALDFLNDRPRFFALVTDAGTVCINRRHVRAARPLS
jgi:hypothetical protein